MEVTMEIERLPSGQVAPGDVDCISIVRRPDGLYDLSGAALVACADGDEAESIALIGLPPFETREDAEDAGLAWAAEQCVERIYVTDVEFCVRT
jgi:hypothetical protein